VWDLKGYAKKHHQIITAIQLQTFIQEMVGVIVTVQTLRALLRSQPPAPRGEMIRLLCDVFNCRSDAFYVFTPNPSRARQWAEDRLKGVKPAPLYKPKDAEAFDGFVKAPDETVQGEKTGKPKSLRATFTDPRMLYKDRLTSRK
jgi:hypothetical protein